MRYESITAEMGRKRYVARVSKRDVSPLYPHHMSESHDARCAWCDMNAYHTTDAHALSITNNAKGNTVTKQTTKQTTKRTRNAAPTRTRKPMTRAQRKVAKERQALRIERRRMERSKTKRTTKRTTRAAQTQAAPTVTRGEAKRAAKVALKTVATWNTKLAVTEKVAPRLTGYSMSACGRFAIAPRFRALLARWDSILPAEARSGYGLGKTVEFAITDKVLGVTFTFDTLRDCRRWAASLEPIVDATQRAMFSK